MAAEIWLRCIDYFFTFISTCLKTRSALLQRIQKKVSQRLINRHSQSWLSKLLPISNAQSFCWEKYFVWKCWSDTWDLFKKGSLTVWSFQRTTLCKSTKCIPKISTFLHSNFTYKDCNAERKDYPYQFRLEKLGDKLWINSRLC